MYVKQILRKGRKEKKRELCVKLYIIVIVARCQWADTREAAVPPVISPDSKIEKSIADPRVVDGIRARRKSQRSFPARRETERNSPKRGLTRRE